MGEFTSSGRKYSSVYPGHDQESFFGSHYENNYQPWKRRYFVDHSHDPAADSKENQKGGSHKRLRPAGLPSRNNILLKNLVARVRPYYAVEGLTPIVTKPSEFSFPSGHAAISFASAGVFYRKLPRKYGVPAVVMAGLISLSRLYVGVHYPTDVLMGILSGTGCSYLGEWAATRLWTQRRDTMRIKHGIPLDNSAPSGAFLS